MELVAGLYPPPGKKPKPRRVRILVRGVEVEKPYGEAPLGPGPGTVLLEMNKQDYGVPACSDCVVTARRMNELGSSGCLEKSILESLIDEIQPRVQRWLELGVVGTEKATEPTWMMRLAASAPDAAKRSVIRRRIRKACRTYEKGAVGVAEQPDEHVDDAENSGFVGLPPPPVDIAEPRDENERIAYRKWRETWG